MSVRLRLALTVLLTGLATAFGVAVAVGLAFERFEREATFARADAFLGRVVAQHADLLDQQQRAPEPFVEFMRSLLLLEPDSQLYLLEPNGTVLARSGTTPLPEGFRVALQPVQAAASAAGHPASRRQAAYVMGDDPEYMEQHAVIAARALQRAQIRPDAALAGYLYMVCRKPGLPASRLAQFAANLAGPALGPVLAVVLLATLLAAWIIAAVTRPLAQLSQSVAEAAERGFAAEETAPAPLAPPPLPARAANDEFARLRHGFETLLARLRAQWDELHRLDAFRRESVSNLSHDLRSPLTAAAAALETLQQRLQDNPPATAAAADTHRLIDVALRNTHNAARLVRALGDLAVLDEAQFKLRRERIDLTEVVDSIVMRFAERAARARVSLHAELSGSGEPLVAEIDVELFERAIANLLDNALRHTSAGGEIVIAAALAAPLAPGRAPKTIDVTVCDSGSGIAEADLSRLFERHVRGRGGAPGARGEGSKGLGLAIVRRIVELHGGEVTLASHPGHGTTVTIKLPRPAHPGARADERSGPISEAGAAAPAPLRPGPRTSPS